MTDDARTIEDLLSELVMLRGRVAELEAREAIPHTSEKKTDEEALRESEEKYRVVVQKAHEGILVAQNGMHRFVNPAAAKIWGYSEEELISRAVAEFIHPDDREMVLNRQLRRAKGEELPGRYPFRIVTKDGTTKWVEIDSASISCAGKPAVLVFAIDVTERKQMEEAIRERDEQYLALVEESFDGIMITSGTEIVFVNSRLCQMLGYSKEELEVMEHRMLGHPEYQDLVLQRALDRMRGESVPPHYELKFQRKDGSIFDAEIHARAIEIRGAPGVQVWIRDITARNKADKELEQLTNQLVQAQKMEAIGTLTGGIAHDFNNLLTIMNGFTELALSEKSEDDPSYSDLHKVLETGRRGAELVQRLLAFSRKAEISLSPLDLNNIVENVIDLVGRTFPKMIEIETILAKDLSMVNADAMQVEQALMNLCINAKEAMPEGGKLKIETRNVAVDMDYCRSTSGARPGLFVLFEVADSGRGMDAETMERMFDPFFTTKGWDFKKGTGLGLSVGKGIVEQHGGWITCQSEPGKGSTFRVYFPLINDSAVFHNPEPLAKGVPGGEKILVVDDEDYVRDLGRSILERSGYTVTTAANGKEALEIYAREQSNIALVVLDLMMPQMGGEKCLEELLKINPQVRVIVSTGHSLDPKEVGHLGVHAKGLVNKPYQMKQFMEVVRGVLAAS